MCVGGVGGGREVFHLPNKIHPSIIPKKQIGDVSGLDWGNKVIMISVFTELFKYRLGCWGDERGALLL